MLTNRKENKLTISRKMPKYYPLDSKAITSYQTWNNIKVLGKIRNYKNPTHQNMQSLHFPFLPSHLALIPAFILLSSLKIFKVKS